MTRTAQANHLSGTSGFLRFVAVAVGAMILLGAIGYFPTLRWSGVEGVKAMIGGCAVSLLASVVGSAPVVMRAGGGNRSLMNCVLGAMLIRVFVVCGLCLAAVFSGVFVRSPLLIWTAISYMVLLFVDTVYVLRSIRLVNLTDMK